MKRKRLIAAVAIALGWAFAACAEMPAPLTTLHAVHQLSNEQASHRLPVSFEATVTYYRGYERNLFVQDGDDAIYVVSKDDLHLLPGDRVLVQGKTLNSFNPIVADSTVTLLLHGYLPKPVMATFDQMIRAETDCKLVTVRGVVRAAYLLKSLEAPEHFLRLQLMMDGGYFDANVDTDDPNALEDLLDAEVEMTGVASEQFDSKMQESGILLHVQNLAFVKILKRAASSPWSLPLTPIERVINVYHFDKTTQRVRVHGTITYYLPGAAVVLQDGAKSIWISTVMVTPLRLGDEADAIGFPEVHDGFINLAYGEVRDNLKVSPVVPIDVTWQTLAPRGYDSPGHHDDLVSIEGRVVAQVDEESQDEMVINADGKQFSAIYRHPFSRAASIHNIPLGAKVRVTGICLLEYSNPFIDQMPFKILLRDFDDVVVVARPPLVNTRNLLIALGLLLLVVFGVLARGWALERRMRRQTAVLSELREAEAELERQRSRILEDINGSRPLAEIIESLTAMISSTLNGAPCWCEIADGAKLGSSVRDERGLRIVHEEIPARSGPPLGAIFAGVEAGTSPSSRESAALHNGARLAALAIETRRLYSDLRRRSEFDLLTDIHNRFSLEKHLDKLIENARNNAGIFGLIYIDLDEFKQVNDVYGHRVGDLYLQEVAMRMKRQLRGHDMLARLGGDEFAVLFSMVPNRGVAEEIAHRLEHCFDQPFAVEGYTLRGSASVGLAIYPEDGATRDSLLSASDAAMYVSKHTKQRPGRLPVDE